MTEVVGTYCLLVACLLRADPCEWGGRIDISRVPLAGGAVDLSGKVLLGSVLHGSQVGPKQTGQSCVRSSSGW